MTNTASDERPSKRPCTIYTDSKADSWVLKRGLWKGRGHSIHRNESFVLSAYVRFNPGVGSPIFGTAGSMPHFEITPDETDSRQDKLNSGMPVYAVDGGLLFVPFAATVTLVWPDIDPAAVGTLEWSLTSYGPEMGEGLPTLGIAEWHVTRFLRTTQTIALPREVTRVSVADSGYGVKVSLFAGAVAIPSPFVPCATGASPDLRIDVLAPLAGVAPTAIPVLLMY